MKGKEVIDRGAYNGYFCVHIATHVAVRLGASDFSLPSFCLVMVPVLTPNEISLNIFCLHLF